MSCDRSICLPARRARVGFLAAMIAAVVAPGGVGCGDDDGAECWNGVLEGAEVCDGTDFGGETCASLAGKPDGPLRCAADCQSIDTSRCHTCGDGVVNGAEDCENEDTAGQTCASVGHAGGSLVCQPDCTYDESGCFDCDDGHCDLTLGEDRQLCPSDCGWGLPAVGATFSCALVPGAGPVCWGQGFGPSPNLLGRGAELVSIQAASDGLYGLTEAGTLWLWALGDTLPRAPAEGEGITAVAAYSTATGHRCWIDASATLSCWGQNDFGQIGNGTTDYASNHVTLDAIGPVRSVAVGEAHTCAVTEDAEVLCWGAGGLGQLGTPPPSTTCGPQGSERPCATSPSAVPDLTGVQTVVAGGAYTCALTEAGGVLCWGADDQGQIGDGPGSDTCDGGASCRTSPTPVGDLTDVTQLSAGAEHVCALAAETLYCWGANASGQLGINTTMSQDTPQAVTGIYPVTAVAAGTTHTCATSTGGAMACWGANDEGQLGTSDTTTALMPALVQDATFMGAGQ